MKRAIRIALAIFLLGAPPAWADTYCDHVAGAAWCKDFDQTPSVGSCDSYFTLDPTSSATSQADCAATTAALLDGARYLLHDDQPTASQLGIDDDEIECLAGAGSADGVVCTFRFKFRMPELGSFGTALAWVEFWPDSLTGTAPLSLKFKGDTNDLTLTCEGADTQTATAGVTLDQEYYAELKYDTTVAAPVCTFTYGLSPNLDSGSYTDQLVSTAVASNGTDVDQIWLYTSQAAGTTRLRADYDDLALWIDASMPTYVADYTATWSKTSVRTDSGEDAPDPCDGVGVNQECFFQWGASPSTIGSTENPLDGSTAPIRCGKGTSRCYIYMTTDTVTSEDSAVTNTFDCYTYTSADDAKLSSNNAIVLSGGALTGASNASRYEMEPNELAFCVYHAESATDRPEARIVGIP